jgi:hypothetical protein
VSILDGLNADYGSFDIKIRFLCVPEPKCGFSKQTVAILDGLNADYGSFDILADDDVRQVGYIYCILLS